MLEFALPVATDVSAVLIWQYSNQGFTDRGIRSFEISFSTDEGASYSPSISIRGLANLDWDATCTAQAKSFSLQSGVTHIRLDNIKSFGAKFVGLAEIRFAVEEESPEDQTTNLPTTAERVEANEP